MRASEESAAAAEAADGGGMEGGTRIAWVLRAVALGRCTGRWSLETACACKSSVTTGMVADGGGKEGGLGGIWLP